MKEFNVVKATMPVSCATYQNTGKTLPTTLVSLKQYFDEIENQESIGACSSFSSLQWRECLRRQSGLEWIEPSYLAEYYESRKLENTTNTDAGATMESAIQVLEQFGVMKDGDDPYLYQNLYVDPDDSKFNIALKLNIKQVQKIYYWDSTKSEFDQDKLLNDTLDALANGHPVLFAMSVYEEFISSEMWQTGILKMPTGNFLGGHGIVAIGFDPSTKMILVINQWGKDFGIKNPAEFQGCFWMPYNYFKQYTWSQYVGFQDIIETKQYWRVQIGAYKNKAGADIIAKQLNDKGYKTYIVFVNGLYKLQLNAFSIEANCRAFSQKLKSEGIDNFIIHY